MSRQRGFIEWFLLAPGVAAFLLVGMLALSAGAEAAQYRYEVPGFYNSLATPDSRLRLVNPTDSPASVVIRGWYPNGVSADSAEPPCRGLLRSLFTVDVTTLDLEEGGGHLCSGFGGFLPAFPDLPRLPSPPPTWFLVVTSDQPLLVTHLVKQQGVIRDFSITSRNVPSTHPPPPSPSRWGAIWAVSYQSPTGASRSLDAGRILNQASRREAGEYADEEVDRRCAWASGTDCRRWVGTFSACGALVVSGSPSRGSEAFIGSGYTLLAAEDAALRACVEAQGIDCGQFRDPVSRRKLSACNS